MEWGEFKIGDLFEIGTGSLINLKSAGYGEIPRVSVQTTSNGIIGYFDESIENARYFENFITVNFFGISYYHPYRASVEMKVHVLKLPNHEFTQSEGIFISSILNRYFNGKYTYGNQLSSSKLKEEDFIIQLPTKNGNIDYEFMESFVAELAAQRVAELAAHLKVTGLNDYVLTAEEKQVLEDFDYGQFDWEEFKIGEIFEVRKGKRLPERVLENTEGDIALINQSTQNNMVARFSGLQGKNEVYKKNAITFGVNTKSFGYQTKDFFTVADVLFFKSHFLNEKLASYFITTIKAQLPPDGWDKIFGLAQMIDFKIYLPKNNNQPNYALMETFITAIQKLVIKDVVQYADRKIEATKEITEK